MLQFYSHTTYWRHSACPTQHLCDWKISCIEFTMYNTHQILQIFLLYIVCPKFWVGNGVQSILNTIFVRGLLVFLSVLYSSSSGGLKVYSSISTLNSRVLSYCFVELLSSRHKTPAERWMNEWMKCYGHIFYRLRVRETKRDTTYSRKHANNNNKKNTKRACFHFLPTRGFALSWPAMSGAEPWQGSKTPGPDGSPIDAEGSMPRDPTCPSPHDRKNIEDTKRQHSCVRARPKKGSNSVIYNLGKILSKAPRPAPGRVLPR